MTKKKQGEDESQAEEFSTEEFLKAEPVEIGETVQDAAQAVEFVRQNYSVPETVGIVHVTEDKQVFYKYNAARIYAQEKKVKIFTIKWD
ncbi:MAG TPA: hypothetical protein VK589_04390 [Chryseolinea sp.]|nr:hypothetical protein [Chryseolinea sp.]